MPPPESTSTLPDLLDEDVALLVREQNLPARFGKHAIVRALFELLDIANLHSYDDSGDPEHHISAGGTVKGTALEAVIHALEQRGY